MLVEEVKPDIKDFIALTLAFFRYLLPMIITVILLLLLINLILFH
jgi:hypothetical protein